MWSAIDGCREDFIKREGIVRVFGAKDDGSFTLGFDFNHLEKVGE